MGPEPKKQSRIAVAKGAIEAARAAHRAAGKQLDERRAQLSEAQIAIRNIPQGTNETEAAALVSRCSALIALVDADSRKLAALEAGVGRAHEDFKTVRAEGEMRHSAAAQLRHKLESARGQLDASRGAVKNLERVVESLTARLAAAEQKASEFE